MNLIDKLKNRVATTYRNRVWYRKLYNEDMLSLMSDSEKRAVRSRYLGHLGFFSVLLLLSLLALGGALLIGSPTLDGNENFFDYRTEESRLSRELDSIYGKGNWEFGVYQTTMDAYRVEVTLSDGRVVEHYYRVEGGNIYRLELE